MGQFSVEKPVLPGSVLSGNQQRILFEKGAVLVPTRLSHRFALAIAGEGLRKLN